MNLLRLFEKTYRRAVSPVIAIEKYGYASGLLSAEKLHLPDFLCIGVEKAGTTWLYENLKKHPQIFMPEKKEINYFSNNYRFFTYPLSYYSQYFLDAQGRLKGEATPSCTLTVSRISFIRKIMPSLKLIIVLRNPIDRLWSSALMHLVTGPHRKIEEISETQFYEVMDKNENLSRGFYDQILTRWRSVFPKENLLILFYDDLVENPVQFMQSCFRFLGVNTDSSSIITTRINKSPEYPMPTVMRQKYYSIYKASLVALKNEFPDKVSLWK